MVIAFFVVGASVVCCNRCGNCGGGCVPDKPGEPPCVPGRQIRSLPCPTEPENEDTAVSPKSGSVWWTLKDEKAFRMGLMETNGIPLDWYIMTDTRRYVSPACRNGGGTEENGCEYWWHGYPVANRNIEVHNPKKIISDALDKYEGFAYQLEWTSYETVLEVYTDNEDFIGNFISV